MKTSTLILFLLLLLLGCTTIYRTQSPNVSLTSNSFPIDNFDIYVLSICQVAQSQLEGNLPELVPYPKYKNCTLELRDTISNGEIVDEVYLLISKKPSGEVFYFSSKNFPFFDLDYVDIDNINYVYMGKINEDRNNIFFGLQRGKIKGFKWEIDTLKAGSDSLTILSLPFIDEKNRYQTTVQVKEVFSTRLTFFKQNNRKILKRKENAVYNQITVNKKEKFIGFVNSITKANFNFPQREIITLPPSDETIEEIINSTRSN